MRVVVQYRRGQVPAEHAEANERALWAWVERLRTHPEHEQTIAFGGGRTVSSSGSAEYDGDVFGISVLRVPHAAAAMELLGEWPELPLRRTRRRPDGTSAMTAGRQAPLAKVAHLFTAPNLAHIATLMPEGRPTTVPVWVGVEGDHLAVLTIPDSIKDRNVRHDPRVALSLTVADNPYLMASVRGQVAQRVEGPEAWTIIDRISQAYTGGPYPERDNRIVLLIDVEVAWSASF